MTGDLATLVTGHLAGEPCSIAAKGLRSSEVTILPLTAARVPWQQGTVS